MPPLKSLLNDIETNPVITNIKKLVAVKKSVIEFQQDVEKVRKVLKDLTDESYFPDCIQDFGHISEYLIRYHYSILIEDINPFATTK